MKRRVLEIVNEMREEVHNSWEFWINKCPFMADTEEYFWINDPVSLVFGNGIQHDLNCFDKNNWKNKYGFSCYKYYVKLKKRITDEFPELEDMWLKRCEENKRRSLAEKLMK